jgi:hypothetical protein
MFNITKNKYWPGNGADCITRDEAVRALEAELVWLNDGASHPETTAALFIHCITATRDPTLLDLASEDIKSRIHGIVKGFETQGFYQFFNAKGDLVEDTLRIKILSELLRNRGRFRPGTDMAQELD